MYLKVELQGLIDPDANYMIIHYDMDDNLFTTVYGYPIYNIFDFFKPYQIRNFKKSGKVRRKILSKQGKWVEVVHI